MPDHLREAVLHTLVAAMVVEASVRLWRIDDPRLKLRLRLFVVAMPLVLLPAFELLAPFRHGAAFADGPALFVGSRWAAVTVVGVGLDQLWLWLAIFLSAVLFAVDFRPWLSEWREARHAHLPGVPCSPGLDERITAHARALGLAMPPRVYVVETEQPLLFCRGARDPRLFVSSATLACLDEAELEGALVHELAHLANHDVRLGWALMVARLLQAWNPVVQVVARSIAADAERRADDTAARVTKKPLALAAGLITIFRASAAGASTSEVLLHAARRRARESLIENRCRRLMRGPQPMQPRRDAVLLGATVLVVSTLAFFIT